MATYQISTYGQVPNNEDGPIEVLANSFFLEPHGHGVIKVYVLTVACSEETVASLRKKGWIILPLQ